MSAGVSSDPILADATARPLLFVWNGPIERSRLVSWIAQRGWDSLPEDLIAFWERTGGGCLYETEDLLGPFADQDVASRLDEANEALRAAGMPVGYVAIHEGLGSISAVRLSDGLYVELAPDGWSVVAEYASLADWYRRVLRAEFAERYGLPA